MAQSSGFLEACPGFLGVPWAVFGRFGEIWSRPGGILGELGGILDLLGPSWKPSWTVWRRLRRHVGHLGGGHIESVLGGKKRSWKPSWAGPSWGLPGLSWSHLGGLLGALGAILGASWAVLGRRKAEKKEMPKSFKHLGKINELGIYEPSWKSSWRPLGSLLGRLGPS